MANWDDAILLAVQAHQRQKDKNGAMNLTRLGEFNERDVQRLEKYWRAWRKLMGLNPAGSDQVLPGEQPEAPGPP